MSPRMQHQAEQDILKALTAGAQSFAELQQHLPALHPVAVAVALAEMVRTQRILWTVGEGVTHYRLPAYISHRNNNPLDIR